MSTVEQKAKGKPTFYPNKLQKPVTTDLTDESRKEVERIKRKLRVSRSDLLEHAWRRMRGLPLNEELEKALIELPPVNAVPAWFTDAMNEARQRIEPATSS